MSAPPTPITCGGTLITLFSVPPIALTPEDLRTRRPPIMAAESELVVLARSLHPLVAEDLMPPLGEEPGRHLTPLALPPEGAVMWSASCWNGLLPGFRLGARILTILEIRLRRPMDIPICESTMTMEARNVCGNA